jgi:hypothetical protein
LVTFTSSDENNGIDKHTGLVKLVNGVAKTLFPWVNTYVFDLNMDYLQSGDMIVISKTLTSSYRNNLYVLEHVYEYDNPDATLIRGRVLLKNGVYAIDWFRETGITAVTR